MKGLICVDGVVGAGKTTLSRLINEKYGFEVFEEPVVNNPILDKYYYDRERWAFPLQVFFLNKRFKLIKEASKLDSCIMDRSIYGDVIFAKMLLDDQTMKKDEYDLYEELLYNMLEHVQKPTLMIYLEVSVDCAIDRIHVRNRDYEQIVERKYWEDLNKNYTEYFKNYNISPLLKINVDNLDFVNNEEDKEKILEIIDKKLKELM